MKELLIWKRLDLLRKEADAYAGNRPNHSGVGLDRACEKTEQAGLSGPVGADEANVVALVHLKREPIKELFSSECEGNAVERG